MTGRFRSFLAGSAILLPVLSPPVARAAILTVTDFGDSGNPGQLRALITAALAGDTIIVPPGAIVLTGAAGEDANDSGDLDIDKDLTIVGAGAALTVIDGGGTDRILDVLGPVDVVIAGVTIHNGNPGRALRAVAFA